MWHETGTEMAVMLKSIFRMDKDYSARLIAILGNPNLDPVQDDFTG